MIIGIPSQIVIGQWISIPSSLTIIFTSDKRCFFVKIQTIGSFAVGITTGSSSTQSGLLAGFAAIGATTRVIGVPDDEETEIKRERVHRLANAALKDIGLQASVPMDHVDLFVGDRSPYGVADAETIAAIKLFARCEGLIADPVYEGKALRGLIELSKAGRLAGKIVLLLHLGGTPAVHAYAAQLGPIELKDIFGPA